MDDLFAPDFEGHYQKLRATLQARASYSPPNTWLAIFTGRWDKDLDEIDERDRAYCENISTLPFSLLYFDLPGIDPRLARVFVLARLVVDNAPVAFLREELKAAIADVIEARETQAPVLLFTERMRVESIGTQDATPLHAQPSFDFDKWSKAMAQQLWGSA